MACPFCGCEHFYVRNPDDEYETCEFDLKGGEPVFTSEDKESWRPELTRHGDLLRSLRLARQAPGIEEVRRVVYEKSSRSLHEQNRED